MKVIAITPFRKMDYLTSLLIEGLDEMGIEIIASDGGNGVKRVYSDSEIISHSKSADYILVFWGKGPDERWPRSSSLRHPKYYLLDTINRPDRTAYIDGSEWTSTGHPEIFEIVPSPFDSNKKLIKQAAEAALDPTRYKGEPWINQKMFDYCRWYFKRECYPEDKKAGIIPLSFGCFNRDFINQESTLKKDIDIFCCFGQSYTGLRHQIINYCQSLKNKGLNVILSSHVGHEEYLNLIRRSSISISAWGGGNCCNREWEVIANKSCCFVQKHMIEITNKPQDGIHWVEYETMDEFDKKINFYLNNREFCDKIGTDGFLFALENHTSISRAKTMINFMRSDAI